MVESPRQDVLRAAEGGRQGHHAADENVAYILTIDGTIYHLGSPGPILEVRVVGSKHNITTRSTAFLFEVVEEGNVKRIWKLISDIQGSCCCSLLE